MRAVQAVVDAAHRRGSRVILNAAPASATVFTDIFEAVDVLVVNEVEAGALFGLAVNGVDDAARAGQAARQAGVGAAVVTLGAAGAVLVYSDEARHIPAFPVQAVDATAAGDAFVGAFGLAMLRGADLSFAARMGAAAGAVAASRAGAQRSLPTPEDLEALLGSI